MKVRDIMSTDVETAAPDSTLEEIAGMMKDEDVGAIPVVDEDELIGIVTDRDIVVRCIAEGKSPVDLTAEEIISENLETVTPGDDIERAARIMAQRQIRRLPVVENGQLVGMLSLGDIAVQWDEKRSGETLEGVSRGAKNPARESRSATMSERQQQLPAAGEKRLGGSKTQATSNQRGGREEGGKKRVVSIRSQGKRGGPGRKASRHKAS